MKAIRWTLVFTGFAVIDSFVGLSLIWYFKDEGHDIVFATAFSVVSRLMWGGVFLSSGLAILVERKRRIPYWLMGCLNLNALVCSFVARMFYYADDYVDYWSSLSFVYAIGIASIVVPWIIGSLYEAIRKHTIARSLRL